VNFSIFSRKATAVELLLFDQEDDAKPARSITIDPATNRTYHYWHVFVPGVGAGQIYAYRIQGPLVPANGLRFDPTRFFLTHTAGE
jgi:glycogen operon protein